jgi:fructan beta-fructosidase
MFEFAPQFYRWCGMSCSLFANLQFDSMDSKIILAVVLFLSLAGCNRNSDLSEKDFPGIHFSLEQSKLGNPVELLLYEDEYHLFYEWEDAEKQASWGHAKTRDLIYWETMNTALEPEAGGNVGSGSIVIDWNHTSGLGKENPPFVAIYVIEGNHVGDNEGTQTLGVAVSRDQGNSWTKLPEKAIELENSYEQLKDTKIIWHEETQRWILLVLTGYEVRFYASDDLLNWEYASVFGENILLKTGQWTNLDFFPIDSQWALFISSDSGSPNEGSGIQYFVGEFDGYTYQSLDDKQKWLDNGSDLYAGVTHSDLQLNQAPVLIGRIFNQKYESPSNEINPGTTLSFPRELFLKEKYGQFYIASKPIEIEAEIRMVGQVVNDQEVAGELELELPELPFEIDLSIDVNNRLYLDMAEAFGVRMSAENGDELLIGYQALRRYFFISNVRKTAADPKALDTFEYMPHIIDRPVMEIKIIVDHSSVELFAVDGDVSLTRKLFQPNEWNKLVVFTENGRIKLNEARLDGLQPRNKENNQKN